MATTPGNPHNLTYQESYIVPNDNTASPFAPAVVYRESHVPMNSLTFTKTVTSGSASILVRTHSLTATGLISLATQTTAYIG